MVQPTNGKTSRSGHLPDTEVLPKAQRRQYSAEYKRRILEEYEACQEAGEKGALLRQEGLYTSHITTWRRQRERGELEGLKPQKRGPKADPQATELTRLRRENERLRKRLEQAELIIEVQKKVSQILGNPLETEELDNPLMIEQVQGLAQKINVSQACQVLGMPRSALYRALVEKQSPKLEDHAPTPSPRSLNLEEKSNIRQILNSERFQDQSPREVYATLLDEGQYYCHWRTMYRILEEHNEVRERRNQLRHPNYQKPELLATGPNQVWSWDITKLLGPVKWTYYYLYVILDIFSRYIVGWMVAETQSATLAEDLVKQTCFRQGIQSEQLTLHADRGSPMIAKSLAMLLADLGVTKSHSRPHVSDDNPYSEAQFKTMKYRPDYPERFGCLIDARAWSRSFFTWYNHEHHHSALGLLTPADVHFGRAEQIRQQRQLVLQEAFERHPERFVQGQPQPPQLPVAVWINPPKELEQGGEQELAELFPFAERLP
ncbi:MAG: IS3 family transposase [Armatimonadota bacterium]